VNFYDAYRWKYDLLGPQSLTRDLGTPNSPIKSASRRIQWCDRGPVIVRSRPYLFNPTMQPFFNETLFWWRFLFLLLTKLYNFLCVIFFWDSRGRDGSTFYRSFQWKMEMGSVTVSRVLRSFLFKTKLCRALVCRVVYRVFFSRGESALAFLPVIGVFLVFFVFFV